MTRDDDSWSARLWPRRGPAAFVLTVNSCLSNPRSMEKRYFMSQWNDLGNDIIVIEIPPSLGEKAC